MNSIQTLTYLIALFPFILQDKLLQKANLVFKTIISLILIGKILENIEQ